MSHQVLTATYNSFVDFVIPKGIDLNDTTKIKGYWVRYGTLHIEFVDGTTQEVEGNEPSTDWKTPNDTEINEEEDDDEDEEEDEEDEDIIKEIVKKAFDPLTEYEKVDDIDEAINKYLFEKLNLYEFTDEEQEQDRETLANDLWEAFFNEGCDFEYEKICGIGISILIDYIDNFNRRLDGEDFNKVDKENTTDELVLQQYAYAFSYDNDYKDIIQEWLWKKNIGVE
jgi:hypothetical protein